MKIINLTISNYRNLDQITVRLDGDCNFIVGENNLGKSNLLTLLHLLFNSRAFAYDDFADLQLPVEIVFELSLDNVEIGHFQDLFETDDYHKIKIRAVQDSPEDNINFYHLETAAFIAPAQLRSLNFIHYNSLRNPVAEINFTSGKGIGKFLRYMIAEHLEQNGLSDAEFLDTAKVSQLLLDINAKVSKIKAFKDFDIKAFHDPNNENLLSKIVVFNDSKGDSLGRTGYGVQFVILIALSILERLYTIRELRGEKGIFVDEVTGKKTISLVLGLDEPEIHLHPYMQRSLIKYLCALVKNQDANFSQLIKELFDVDAFTGQVIVVTHSPNIILNDYKQIVRFYKEQSVTKVISGSNVPLSEQLLKHLHIHFPFIKEAFFARCAIFVEGASELASFPGFSTTMGIDLDELGICVIQAGGDAVKQLMDVAAAFAIPSVGINDRDTKTGSPSDPGLFWTDKRNFEGELIELIDSGQEASLRKILLALDSLGVQRRMEKDTLNKYALRRFGLVTTPFAAELILANIPAGDTLNLKAYYVTWLSINKGLPLGLLIGEHLAIGEIPAIYQTVLNTAKATV